MKLLRKAFERGHTKTGWLDSWHTFSFGNYFDRSFLGFSDLRVINDDIVESGQGFATHYHDNMEIITVVLSGELEHKDSMGNGSIIKVGEVQKMSAGTGITHSEFNPRKDIPVHFLQIWIIPNEQDISPMYAQKKFGEEQLKNKLHLIASEGGKNESIPVTQDVELYQSFLDVDKKIKYKLNKNRLYWIHVAEGGVEIDDQILATGDGLAIAEEDENLEIKGLDDKSNILIFNLAK